MLYITLWYFPAPELTEEKSMKKLKLSQLLQATVLLSLVSSVYPQSALAEPFLSEIRWVAFNYAPRGWAECNGQLLPINQNQALFSLLGTTYGGDGRVNFALPDMRSRAPIHVSNGHTLGERGGQSSHALTRAETSHLHIMQVDPREANSADAANNFLAKTSDGTGAFGSSATGTMAADSVTAHTSTSQPHSNMKPFLTLNCIIALQGIFPSPN